MFRKELAAVEFKLPFSKNLANISTKTLIFSQKKNETKSFLGALVHLSFVAKPFSL